ncbi:ArgS-related anticodon-binding protein NrtL [Streptomyces showdoensis]|uniref:arginine--tRNA ligase n=1 Tax=Streptomyces showdoensis TaxID=68268 RepID=A0A2P2GKZ3_STREW|nr:arginine--tRNA ligase [Streptomyces showdoensis]KKZ72177.1 arginyl-tRNA synthetase [Streptomyces showdoensis]
MTPADLSLTVLHAVRRAVDEGALRVDVPAGVKVERPRPGGVGDYASSIALSLARPSGRRPLDVAGILQERLHGSPGIRAVDITGPGFLNFTLDVGQGGRLVREIGAAGLRYGYGDALGGEPVRLAPSGEARARVVGETVLRLLRSQGADAGTGDGGQDDERVHVVPAAYEPEVLGVDPARWALLRPAPQDHALPGAPLLVQHERNPLFRVRYAHSRARALLRNGAQLGVRPAYEGEGEQGSGGSELVAVLADHPGVLLSAARHRAPDRLARHLEGVADALLSFQHTVLPLGDEKPSAAHRSRLALAEAAGTVLAGGLSLLGISAPDQI